MGLEGEGGTCSLSWGLEVHRNWDEVENRAKHKQNPERMIRWKSKI